MEAVRSQDLASLGLIPAGPPYLVEELEELGAGLVDGADDGPPSLGQAFHQGDHLEARGAVQAAARRGAPETPAGPQPRPTRSAPWLGLPRPP